MARIGTSVEAVAEAGGIEELIPSRCVLALPFKIIGGLIQIIF